MKIGRIAIMVGLTLPLLLWGCRKEKYAGLSLGIERTYLGVRLQPMRIACGLSGGEYEWRIVSVTLGDTLRQLDTLVGREQEYIALLDEVGVYQMTLDYRNGADVLHEAFSVHIEEESTSYSPYISDVLEYRPAPGQQVNVHPRMSDGISREEMLARCRRAICGNKQELISLGGFGGSVTFAFDHVVINQPGEADFKVFGNAGTLASEPGVVMVAYDANGNGAPDEDEWYELRGSADSARVPDYSVTYFYQGESAPASVDSVNAARGYANPTYIRWEDNQGGSGFIPRMAFGGSNSYWPANEGKRVEHFTLSGTRLPNNGTERIEKVKKEKDGVPYYEYQVEVSQTPLGRGYVDDVSNDEDAGLDIDDAVDRDGKPVRLVGIHFVRVYTGINQQIGRRGESSTEIRGAVDLHLLKRLGGK